MLDVGWNDCLTDDGRVNDGLRALLGPPTF